MGAGRLRSSRRGSSNADDEARARSRGAGLHAAADGALARAPRPVGDGDAGAALDDLRGLLRQARDPGRAEGALRVRLLGPRRAVVRLPGRHRRRLQPHLHDRHAGGPRPARARRRRRGGRDAAGPAPRARRRPGLPGRDADAVQPALPRAHDPRLPRVGGRRRPADDDRVRGQPRLVRRAHDLPAAVLRRPAHRRMAHRAVPQLLRRRAPASLVDPRHRPGLRLLHRHRRRWTSSASSPQSGSSPATA